MYLGRNHEAVPNIPEVDTTPNPTTWGSNAETLSGNKTLTDSDSVVQTLNPNGAERSIVLPTLSNNNPFFHVFNSGFVYDLVIRTSSVTGPVVTRIRPGDGVSLVSTGLSGEWRGSRFADSIYSNDYPVILGAICGSTDDTTNDYGSAFDTANNAGSATPTTIASLPVPADGHIYSLARRNSVATVDATLVIEVNGSDEQGVRFSRADNKAINTFGDNNAVRTGDQILVRGGDSGGSNSKSFVSILSKQTGHALWFGGDVVTNINQWSNPMGAPRGVPSLAGSQFYYQEYVLANSGTLQQLALVCTSDPTSWTFTIYKNGSSVGSVALVEVEEIGTGWRAVTAPANLSFSSGDRLAIAHSGPTSPLGETAITAFMAGVSGAVYGFGGVANGAPPGFYGSFRNASAAGLYNAASEETEVVMAQNGTIKRIGLKAGSTRTGTIGIYKNGALSESPSRNNQQNQVMTGLTTSVAIGDDITIQNNTTLADNVNILMYVE